MTVIALESSTLRPSVAVWHGGRCLQAWLSTERSHAADLLPSVSALLHRLDRTPGDVSRIVVGRGPGSYTGLRVAAATALGVARGTGAAIGGLSSFEALAWRELAVGGRCAVLLDARAGEAYWAVLARDAADVRFEVEPSVARSEDVAALLPREVAIFSSAGIEKSVRLDDEQRARVRVDAVPQASALLELALARGGRVGSDIEPLYLRAFAAKPRRA
ncbi:MAG: tRNA (adenosine(37)-N6)-threonylcarbamoyltransferase complex dimerization subunit type 1 TsaB [Planctomycetes bacterium]|nr:tRNA (adenosine(37)-N6)-threonylcarbamoyltransferase complex dimerization subunit type 1 TsaB [Planctomycetota bacterium]